MEYDEYQNFLEAERERRKTDREREIERLVADASTRHKRSLDAEIAPLLAELTEIEKRKPPLPIWHEGNLYEYVATHRAPSPNI